MLPLPSQCRRTRLETGLERTIRAWAPDFRSYGSAAGKTRGD